MHSSQAMAIRLHRLGHEGESQFTSHESTHGVVPSLPATPSFFLPLPLSSSPALPPLLLPSRRAPRSSLSAPGRQSNRCT
jgi:hypothetical protein